MGTRGSDPRIGPEGVGSLGAVPVTLAAGPGLDDPMVFFDVELDPRSIAGSSR
jgi:hypothetical protein